MINEEINTSNGFFTSGKYQGLFYDAPEVPKSYLKWIVNQKWFKEKYPDFFDILTTFLRTVK